MFKMPNTGEGIVTELVKDKKLLKEFVKAVEIGIEKKEKGLIDFIGTLFTPPYSEPSLGSQFIRTA